MAVSEAPPITVHCCCDSAEYVRQVLALGPCAPPTRGVPTLRGDRSADHHRRVFPGRAFSEGAAIQTGQPISANARDLAQLLIAARTDAGDPRRVLIVLADRTDSLPAIYYGLATGRSVRLVADFDDIHSVLVNATSAILAGPPELFGKRFLNRLLAWVQQTPAAPRQIGIITGRDDQQIFDLVAKLLLAKMDAGSAQRSSTVRGDAFEFVSGHGNELHLSYRDGVLCGRSAALAAPADAAFDCEVGCQFKPRYLADQVAKDTVFLISCDGFTPSDGFAPPAFSLLFGLLDGPVSTILAPYKHVQANAALLTMIKALASASYPLGEIAFLANGRSNYGMLPDFGYLVLGDPERTVAPHAHGPAASPEIVSTPLGVLVRTAVRPNQAALTIRLPAPPIDQPLALVPVSDNLRSTAALFAIGTTPGQREIDVTLFDPVALPAGVVEFAVVAAQRAEPAMLAEASARMQGCRLFAAILGAADGSADAQARLWELLHLAVAFPRLIESTNGQARMLQLGALVAAQCTQVQHALADALLAALGTQRLWISQEYVTLFASVTRAGTDHDGDCPHCANYVTTWRYADPLTSLPSRHMRICDRCGIIADAPMENPLVLAVDTIGSLRTCDAAVITRVTNRGAAPLGVSLAVQMNRWQSDGIVGTDCRIDLELAAGQTVAHSTTLHLPSPFQDDVLAIQAFAVTDQFELIFASQKVTTMVRPR